MAWQSRARQSCVMLIIGLAACSGDNSNGANEPRPAPQIRLSITSVEDYPGTFGSVGAYERLRGMITGEVDPPDPRNAIIQNLTLAPVNERGMVEYVAKSMMLNPKDMSKASGVLRYDAPTAALSSANLI